MDEKNGMTAECKMGKKCNRIRKLNSGKTNISRWNTLFISLKVLGCVQLTSPYLPLHFVPEFLFSSIILIESKEVKYN